MVLRNENDRAIVARLYQKHKALLVSRAYNILRDTHLADDAVIETMIRVSNNLYKIDEENVPQTRSYMVTICENVAKTMYVKRKKEMFIEQDIIENDDANNPVEVVVGRDTVQQIASAIENLPGIHRDILLLNHTHKHSHAELCEMLGIPLTTLKKRIQRARQKLEECLKREGLK